MPPWYSTRLSPNAVISVIDDIKIARSVNGCAYRLDSGRRCRTAVAVENETSVSGNRRDSACCRIDAPNATVSGIDDENISPAVYRRAARKS